MTRLADRWSRSGEAARGGGRQRASMVAVQLLASAALVLSILIAAAAVSIGAARAQGVGASVESDGSLVLALLVIAIAVMGILSAAAARFTGRPRGH